jgi:uncharacterized Zn-finger protein
MTEAILPDHKGERLTTGDLRVACDGPQFSKHPRVYLTMVDNAAGQPSFVVCPYCSRVYLYDAKLAKPSSGH